MSTCRNCGGLTEYENDFCTECFAKYRKFKQKNGFTGPGAAAPFDICYWSQYIEQYKRDLIREGKTTIPEIQTLVKTRIEERQKEYRERQQRISKEKQREAEIAKIADQV